MDTKLGEAWNDTDTLNCDLFISIKPGGRSSFLLNFKQTQHGNEKLGELWNDSGANREEATPEARYSAIGYALEFLDINGEERSILSKSTQKLLL